MNIWHYELTDKRSAAVRFALRLLWFLLGFALVWVLLQPPRLVTFLVMGAVLYLCIVGFALDHWKLRRLETSRAIMRWVATLAMLPILVGIPIVISFFG